MVSQTTILNALKIFCGTLLVTGIGMFLIGIFGNASGAVTGIGIGVVMGAVFIFLMGIFFTIVQEVFGKTKQPVEFPRQDNVIPFVRKPRQSHRF